MARRALLAGALLAAACGRPPEPADSNFPLRSVTGREPGPRVALVAGVHGGKVAAVHALDSLASILPGRLRAGRVLILAPANAAGFRAGLAQTSPDDSLNLNRVFPGDSLGSPTQRLAARILRDIVSKSDYLVDLHGSDGDEAVGAFAYAARPGLDARVDSTARWMAERWGVPTVVWDQDGPRTLAESRFLQTAAHLSGVPAITVFEAGATREDASATARFVQGALDLLGALGMLERSASPGPTGAASEAVAASDSAPPSSRILPRRAVLLAESDGEWMPSGAPGDEIPAASGLGTFRDSAGEAHPVRSEVHGIVLHQRRAGRVRRGTPLAILGVLPDVN